MDQTYLYLQLKQMDDFEIHVREVCNKHGLAIQNPVFTANLEMLQDAKAGALGSGMDWEGVISQYVQYAILDTCVDALKGTDYYEKTSNMPPTVYLNYYHKLVNQARANADKIYADIKWLESEDNSKYTENIGEGVL